MVWSVLVCVCLSVGGTCVCGVCGEGVGVGIYVCVVSGGSEYGSECVVAVVCLFMVECVY